MSRYLVDTNILVRLITNDVPDLAQRAEAMISPLDDGVVELPLYVLAEVVYVLAYNTNYLYSRERIRKSLLVVIGIPQFSVNRQLIGQVVNTFTQIKLDFVDCLLLCHGNQTASQVLTFDKKLLRELGRLNSGG